MYQQVITILIYQSRYLYTSHDSTCLLRHKTFWINVISHEKHVESVKVFINPLSIWSLDKRIDTGVILNKPWCSIYIYYFSYICLQWILLYFVCINLCGLRKIRIYVDIWFHHPLFVKICMQINIWHLQKLNFIFIPHLR